jgi:outer membrane protein assembly factor BamD
MVVEHARLRMTAMLRFLRSWTPGRPSTVAGVQLSIVIVLALLTGCATGPKQPPTGTPEPDRFLYERGSEALNDRKWLTSREYFRQLVDVYPQSPHRADAKLGVGDTYLGEGTPESYLLAINEFREFLSYYPTHRRADYAQYKLGMSHYYQMRAPERDQTETREAIRELTTFMERFPSSALREEAAAKLREARDRLSMSEQRVGVHYHRQKWYPGAIERFKGVLSRDPNFTNRDETYFYLAEAFEKIQRPAEALPYYDRLIKEFEKSEYLVEAQKRAELIRNGMAKKTEGLPKGPS